MAAPSKTTTAVDACAEVAQNAVREGALIDMSTIFEAALHIDLALCTETAHTGSRVIVQTSGNSEGDEDWTDLWDVVYLIGTAVAEAITNNPAAAGTTVFTIADEVGYVANGVLDVFLEDTVFANSEWMKLVSAVVDTSLTVLDGSKREHAQTSSIFYNKAKRIIVPLGNDVYRARVIYDNTYDPDGSTIACQSRVVKVTGVA